MATPTSDTPDSPPLPSPATRFEKLPIADIRKRLEALGLSVDGPRRTLLKRLQKHLKTLQHPNFFFSKDDSTSNSEERCDEAIAGDRSDESEHMHRRSLSPPSAKNLPPAKKYRRRRRGPHSAAVLSRSFASTGRLPSASPSVRSQHRRSHIRHRLHLNTRRTRRGNRSLHPARCHRHYSQRRNAKERNSPLISPGTQRATLEKKLTKILERISEYASLKQKRHRYFQKKGTDYDKLKASWKKFNVCKLRHNSKRLSLPQVVSSLPQVSAQMHTSTREQPHLPRRLNSGPMTPEYRSFQSNIDELHSTIGAQLPIRDLSMKMWGKGLITHSVWEKITQSEDPQNNKQLLLNALRNQIATNVDHYYTFLDILCQQPALQDCHRKLEEHRKQLEEDYAVPLSSIEKYAEHLKTVYLSGDFPQKWPKTMMTKFIKLITTEEDGQNFISMQDMFQDKGGGRVSRVLVKGGPGTGKSTFALELCKRWGRGEMFHEFSLVILLPLCYPNVKTAKSLSDLLRTYCNDEEEQKKIAREISYIEGEGVLLILEGLNELPITRETKDARDFLSRLFALTVLPKATVLVTSRSHVRPEYVAQTVQIDGFGEDEVQEYIREAGLSDEQRTSLKEHLHLNPDICEMMYNPLHCAILVELYQTHGKEMSPLKTITQLFHQLVKHLLLGYLKEKSKMLSECEDFPKCLPSPEYCDYNKLCKLAYQGFIQGQSEFCLSKSFNHLNLMQAFVKPFEGHITFRFLHHLLQEFLTAFWIHEHYSPEEQFLLLKEHLSDPGRYDHVLRFLTGLSNTLKWRKLAKCAFVDRSALKIASFYLDNDIQGVQLPFLSWLFENQDTDLCAKVLGKGKIGFYSNLSHGSPLDYHALAYCIANSECKWEVQIQLPTVNWLDTFSKSLIFQASKTCGGTIQAIDIAHCQISDTEWNLLFSDSKNPLQSLRQLILYDTIPPPTVQHFSNHLPKLKHLQCLALSKTQLGEGGAVSLMETLPKTEISELHLCKTGIGSPDFQALAHYLSDPQCKLKSLDISYNNLLTESVDVFTQALVHNDSLTKLSMSGSTFSSESFSALVSRLGGTCKRTPLTVLDLQYCTLPQESVGQLCMAIAEDEDCALQSLGLSHNPLEPKDVEVLTTMLQANHSITYLYLKNCSISATGFSALTSSLHNNTTLCELSLSGNEMSQESISAVCQAFFSEARFACENIPKMRIPPLLCLDSCPDEWKTTIIENASECLQMYYFFQTAKTNHLNDETLPDVKEFMEVTDNIEQKWEVCSHYLHFGEHDHDPSCGSGRDRIEEMRPSYVP